MSCQKTYTLLHAYLDGELDAASSIDFEQHLRECEACASAYRGQELLRAALGSESLYYSAPLDLQNKIRSSLRRAKSEAPPRVFGWHWVTAGAALAATLLVVFTIWKLVPTRITSSGDDLLAQEVVSDHVRSLMAGHLADVATSDQHTVKPWFNGKLDFSPPVRDFSSQGFPLVGGRLDYLNNKTVAALIYQRNKHYINLFVWPSGETASTSESAAERQGYNMVHWTGSSMNFWAVSDLNAAELSQFTHLVQQAH